MVSPGAIVAATIAARHRRQERERQRREAENRRRREAENRRRREAEKKEAERRRMEEEARARHKAEQKKLLHHQRYKAKVLANNKNSSQNLVFTDKLEIPLNELKVVHRSMNEELLIDGSRMSKYEETYGYRHTYYKRTFPDGRHHEYIETLDKKRNRCLRLLKEELPDGQVVLYDNGGRKTYEKDAEGNYSAYQYDGYSDKIVNTKKGKCEYLEPDKFTDKLEIPSDELEEVYRKGDERLLSDGSRMYCYVDESWGSTYYERRFPDGRHQEYIETFDKERNKCLRLLKEELPNGEIVSFDERGRKTYEKDAQGNYSVYQYEKYSDKIVNTKKGKCEYLEPDKFTDKLEIPSDELEEVYRKGDERLLSDGSRMSRYEETYGYRHTYYERTFPDGRYQEYIETFDKERNKCLRLLKEELPNGQVVLYDNGGRKTYEKDAEGNYSAYQYDGYSDKIVNTKKGKCEYLEPDKFTDKLEIPSDELEEVYRKGDERLLSDGSSMFRYEETYGYRHTCYERRFPDGRHQEYIETFDKERNKCLRLLKEELPNGEIVAFDERGRKTYEKDAEGNSRFCKYDVSGKRTEVIGNNENWKETTYDENGKIEYYRTSDEPKKSYYPSGSLREEIKDNGECYRYAENGICLYENKGGGTYTEYQLTPDGKDRQLLTRMEKSYCMESCSYYASGQLKERSVRNEGVYRYAENGLCVYKYLYCGDYEHYMLTPDGKDRLLLEKSKDGKKEIHSYYPSGKLESSSFSNGDVIKYDEDGNYQKFDGKERLIEEKNSLGKTVYSYYPDTSQVKHINKYDEKGQEIRSEYRHFDKKGNDDTQYYLNIKKMIAKKIQKDAEEAKKRIGFEGERKVGRKMSDVSKLVLVMKARMRK